MTEAQWLRCEVPRLMLEAVASAASERKLRLFAAACLRRAPGSVADDRCARAVEVAEQYADWLVHDDVLDQARAAVTRPDLDRDLAGPAYVRADVYEVLLSREMTASRASAAASHAAWEVEAKARQARNRLQRQTRRARRKGAPPEEAEPTDPQAAAVEERRRQCALLRDVFAALVRPVVIAPAWRARDVIALARAAYDDRLLPGGELDPQRLAVLADALEEAGCTASDVLTHLRSPGPHVRGCWPVDLLLSKE
jgi:hypothetical protein